MPSPVYAQPPLALTVRRSKVLLLQAFRLARWATQPGEFPVASHRSQLDRSLLHQVSVSTTGVQSHPRLEEGKLGNLRLAAAHFDGRLLTPAHGFSFWRLLGRPTQGRGFLPGTEVRDGCVVPTIGGGLCLLSGALFRLAAELDWIITERHGHTVAPENFEQLDATVFWPFVDLRFAPRHQDALLRVQVVDGTLRVAAYGTALQQRTILEVRRQALPGSKEEQRLSTIIRKRPDSSEEQLGIDSQRVLPHGLRRNCLTCSEFGCRARKTFLEVL